MKKAIIRLLFLLFVLIFLNSLPAPISVSKTTTPPPTGGQAYTLNAIPSIPTRQTVLVTRVVDGDTIEITGGQKVRYIGIDTPEVVDPRKPIECFGEKAKERNQQLVENKTVELEIDVSETDKYGRLLRYVYVDGFMVNQLLVKEGFAKSASYPPDIKYQHLFKQAETKARKNNAGLWSRC